MNGKVIRIEVSYTNTTLVLLFGALALVAIGLLLWTAGGAAAAPAAERDGQVQTPTGTASIVGSKIHYQGRLEGATGPVLMTFTLYGDQDGATMLWAETKEVTPVNGLINVQLGDVTPLWWGTFDGRELWLGVGAGEAGEMRPLQEILPVPYAMSLRPGAIIQAELAHGTMFLAQNQAETGLSSGIYGKTDSPEGYGGTFVNSAGGVALRAEGRIECVRDSTQWFPGTLAQPRIGSEDLDMYYHGDGLVRLDAISDGAQQIVMPLSIPAVVYGQSTKVMEVHVAYQCQGATDGSYIDKVVLYLRSATGDSSEIAVDTDDHHCIDNGWRNIPLYLSEELTNMNGILTLEITAQMTADGTNNQIYIAGARVGMRHY